MDQQTLGCKYPTIHTQDFAMDCAASLNDAGTSNKPPLLRRVSHSDTRLHVPHFLSVQDKGFHTNLPSLFENVSGFQSSQQWQLGHSSEKTNIMNDCAPERKPSLGKPGFDRNKSAFELYSSNTVNDERPLIRKTSSVTSYRNFEGHNVESHPSSNSLLSSALHFVTGNNSSLAIQKIPEDDEGGLKMTVTGSSFATSALASSPDKLSHLDSSVAHTTSSHLASGGLANINSLTEPTSKPKSGMLGVFNRGFFGKRVLDDRENSYRYLLAADKF